MAAGNGLSQMELETRRMNQRKIVTIPASTASLVRVAELGLLEIGPAFFEVRESMGLFLDWRRVNERMFENYGLHTLLEWMERMHWHQAGKENVFVIQLFLIKKRSSINSY